LRTREQEAEKVSGGCSRWPSAGAPWDGVEQNAVVSRSGRSQRQCDHKRQVDIIFSKDVVLARQRLVAEKEQHRLAGLLHEVGSGFNEAEAERVEPRR
jgi:hypothetical protein